MRNALLLLPLAILAGCVTDHPQPSAEAQHQHPLVRIRGVDGTVFNGELLNGSVTIESGQGQLTLLTDHMTAMQFGADSDTVDSASIKVSGKLKETQFMLRSEHGVFTLMKERLTTIEFVNAPGLLPAPGEPAPPPGATQAVTMP